MFMKNFLLAIGAGILWVSTASAQIEKVEPPFWWTDMPVQELQLKLYGKELGHYRATVEYNGVEITQQIAVDSPNYYYYYLCLYGYLSCCQSR